MEEPVLRPRQVRYQAALRPDSVASLILNYHRQLSKTTASRTPPGDFEIPLMIQDRQFAADGTLLYPPAQNGTHPVWVQEFFGDTICVNGKAKPFLEVEPRKYRFRIVNASNSRFYHLSLVPADESGKPNCAVANAPPFQQIGSDSGLLPSPVQLHYLIASPGERLDVVIDFTDFKGSNLALVNDAPAPCSRGGEVVPAEVMLFKVTKPLSSRDTSALPDTLVPWSPLTSDANTRERILALTEMDRPSDGYTMIGLLDQKHWDDPITEDPQAGPRKSGLSPIPPAMFIQSTSTWCAFRL